MYAARLVILYWYIYIQEFLKKIVLFHIKNETYVGRGLLYTWLELSSPLIYSG